MAGVATWCLMVPSVERDDVSPVFATLGRRNCPLSDLDGTAPSQGHSPAWVVPDTPRTPSLGPPSVALAQCAVVPGSS